ncbi:hypothetical protein Droror1_Dr00011095 [Drosera rotundifolia]
MFRVPLQIFLPPLISPPLPKLKDKSTQPCPQKTPPHPHTSKTLLSQKNQKPTAPKVMKVSISSTQNSNTNSPNLKPLAFHITTTPNTTSSTTTTTISPLCYEPTSVLDLESSPGRPITTVLPPPPTVPDLHSAANSPSLDLDNLDGWDSILTELGLNDDYTFTTTSKTITGSLPCGDPHLIPLHLPDSQPPDHNITASIIVPCQTQTYTPGFDQYNSNHNPDNLARINQTTDFTPLDQNDQTGFDLIDEVIRAAQSFESNDIHHVHVILARLNFRLGSLSSNPTPVHRAAFYFKEALTTLLSGPNRPVRSSALEIVQSIRSYKVFCGISPLPLFSTFAATQSILDSLSATAAGVAGILHVVDFDVGFGSHWASLIRDIAASNSAISLRITAVVGDQSGAEIDLVRENLILFARELGVEIRIQFVLDRSFEISSLRSINSLAGERIAIHLTPSILRQHNISKFISDLRGLSPNVIVVVVDREIGIEIGPAAASSSFSVRLLAAMEFYTAMMESLDPGIGGTETSDWARRIEATLIRPRIDAAVEAAVTAKGGALAATPWREAMERCGARAMGPSRFAEFQAESLLRRMRATGFHVARRDGELLLCWRGRPLVATSAWRW